MATEAPVTPSSEFAGAAYLDLIEQQLDSEQRRKDSVEQRGLALVTISGLLAGVLFALVTWATEPGRDPLDPWVEELVIVSVALFFVGALFGFLAFRTKSYPEPKVAQLKDLLDEGYWRASAQDGTLSVAEVLVKVLEGARAKNKWKAGFLEAGVWFEVLGAMVLLANVVILLRSTTQ